MQFYLGCCVAAPACSDYSLFMVMCSLNLTFQPTVSILCVCVVWGSTVAIVTLMGLNSAEAHISEKVSDKSDPHSDSLAE